ncbi:protein abrupt-like [Linepithema humile]|uniref:protein abrupt-like n=1 Tax=Linepithema humile TaxID=83485 RepID=UPI0006234BCD|nr:PREDICTED: protein abrupt-like [Linepithema humile]
MATVLSSKEFSFKWTNFSNNLTSGFLSHLSENDLVDVTLAVEGQLLVAHKLVLSVCSPYFKNIFKEYPCQHPVIILKDVKYAEIAALMKFMYQGEINVKQEDLSTFLKVAQMLQIKGLEEGEAQIIPLLNDYVNVSDLQCDFDDVTVFSDTSEGQGSSSKASDRSVRSHRMARKNTKKRKKSAVEDDYSSIKQSRKSNISKNDVSLLSDDDINTEKDLNDSKSEKDIKNDIEASDTMNNDKEIIELSNESNESNTERNSMPSGTESGMEPVTYRLSARGRPQLVHNGYVYNLTSRSNLLNRSHYRCAEQHRGCRGKCSVIAESFMPTGVHDHNHLPGYQSEYDYRKKKGMDTNNV